MGSFLGRSETGSSRDRSGCWNARGDSSLSGTGTTSGGSRRISSREGDEKARNLIGGMTSLRASEAGLPAEETQPSLECARPFGGVVQTSAGASSAGVLRNSPNRVRRFTCELFVRVRSSGVASVELRSSEGRPSSQRAREREFAGVR